jgi:hypothetical protein
MISRAKTAVLGSAALLILPGLAGVQAAAAGDDNQTPVAQIEALQAEVNQLKAEVKAMKKDQQSAAAAQSDQQQAAAMAGLSRDVERRSQFLDASGTTAGFSDQRGFFIASDDNNFFVSPFALLQIRNATSWRQDEKSRGSDDTQNGIEIRRLQFGLDGNAFSPDLTYRIFWQSSEITTGNLSLLMAWVQYRIHDTPWVIGGGQFKDPLDHEQLVGDAAQLAADRTFTDDILAGGEAFSKGVTLRYDNDGALRAETAFTSGFNNNNTNFEGFPTNPTTFGLAGRAEYKFLGQWKDYNHFTSEGNKGDVLVAGGGIDWTEGGHTNAIRHVIDVQYNPGLIGLYAAYLGRYTSGNTAGRMGNTYDSSIRLQASYLFTEHWEAFGRYDYLHLDGREFKAGETSSVQEFTAGATYYFHGERAKFTVDLSYLPKGTPMADPGNDILESTNHGELVCRGQFQLML